MLILLSMILFVQAHSQTLQTETPHPGPRSKAEPELLFAEGTLAFEKAEFETARKDYERLIERYPSHAHTLKVYPKLIVIYSNVQHDSAKTIKTIQKYLLLKPDSKQVIEMKVLLADAYLNRNQWVEAKITAEEIIKSSDANDQMKATALLTKTEVLSRQKKFPEARASFDAVETLSAKFDERFKMKLPGLQLTLKTRECLAAALRTKKKYTDDDFLDYFTGKDQCLKDALPITLNTEDTAPMQSWCTAREALESQLKKQKMDPFLKEKISKQLSETEAFAKSLNAELVHCL